MTGVQMCLPTVMGNWPVHAGFFLLSFQTTVLPLQFLTLFPPALQVFLTLSNTGFPQGAASLAEELSCVLHPKQILLKKNSFSVGVR